MNPRNWKPKLILNWETQEENVEYYTIYRSTSELSPLNLPERYSTANPKETRYIDRWISNNTNYNYLVGSIKNSQESFSNPIQYYVNTEFGDEHWDSVLSLISFNSLPIRCEKDSDLYYSGKRELEYSEIGRALKISDDNPRGIHLVQDSKFNLLQDFTLEFFVHLFNTNDCTIYKTNPITISILNSKLKVQIDTGTITTQELDFKFNKFQHVVVQRRDDFFSIYLNGRKRIEFILSGTLVNTINASIGSDFNNQNYITGLIDEFRLTTQARYTEDFAVIVSSFPNYGRFKAPYNLEYLYTEQPDLFEPYNLTYKYE